MQRFVEHSFDTRLFREIGQLLGGFACYQNDGSGWGDFPDLCSKLQTVHAGHLEIRYYQRKTRIQDFADGLFTASGAMDIQSYAAEEAIRHLENIPIVVYHKNTGALHIVSLKTSQFIIFEQIVKQRVKSSSFDGTEEVVTAMSFRATSR
jgi:hypothetical protein